MLTQVSMGNKYNQLGPHERDLIGNMIPRGKSLREIAKIIGRNPSTISREIKRNKIRVNSVYYFSIHAHKKAITKRSESRKITRLKDNSIRSYVRGKLYRGWSPEIIAGRLPIDRKGLSISHEAIYQWIYCEAPQYIKCLVRKHANRKSRTYRKRSRECLIPGRVSINERPTSINDRSEAGHWEADAAMFGMNKPFLHVSTERKTRYSVLIKMEKKKAPEVARMVIRRFTNFPRSILKKSFTYDNGKENASHIFVNGKLGTRSYFCNSYCSWEKGTVENTIGLIRRRLPKKIDLANVSRKQIKYVQDWLNHRPRKCLDFRTPSEVFQSECCT